MSRTLTRDDHLPARLCEGRAASAHRREINVVAQQSQLNELTPVQREIREPLIVNDLADFGVGRTHEGRRFRHCDFFGDCADVEQKIEIEMLSALDDDTVADLGAESGQFRPQYIFSVGKRRKHVVAAGICQLIALLTATFI